jgi:hypothetical protein
MNGISRSWIIKKIEEALQEAIANYKEKLIN